MITDSFLTLPLFTGREAGQTGTLPGASLPVTAPPAAPLPASGVAVKDEAELRKIANDFESLFSQMLMSSMRKTVQKSPLFHGGRGQEIFSELLDNNYAKAMSNRGRGLGISDMIVKKYAAHVRVQGDHQGQTLDIGRNPAAVPAGEVKRR